MHAADIDGDGDMDIVAAANTIVSWYENDGTPANGGWTARTITVAASGSRTAYVADVDGDGDLDVLSASTYDDKITWYANDGTPANDAAWASRTISTAANAPRSVYAADVDGDGDLDAMSASWYDHKVAWYENTVFDFGDAPVPYPTLSTDNGARHETEGPMLGTLRDVEADGTHSSLADADGAGDDGVVFGPLRVGQLGATVTVNVQNAPSGAKLDGWIDFDGDGNWGGPAEHVADSVSVVNGNNVLTFDIPSGVLSGVTFARFRLSTAGNLGVNGAAADGEVEDHAVTIEPPAAANGLFGGQTIISTTADGAISVYAADMDGDGDLDVLSASFYDNKIAWYVNDGTPANDGWTARIISLSTEDARSVYAADVDGDGDLDVLTASLGDDTIAWYESDGTPADGGWTARDISITADGAVSVHAADVDGDGDLDVLSASFYDDAIAWYENDGTPANGGWTARDISITADSAFSVYAADVDRDGDLDVLSASRNDDTIAWYENDGTPANGGWTARDISTTADSAHSVYAADVDGDGDLDVLSASRNDDTIAWYENDGTPSNGDWTARDISTTADSASRVYAADVDGDGDMDVLSASSGDHTIAWYENDGTPADDGWIASDITTTADSAVSVYAADVDGDGDLDVLSASVYDDKIAWYENLLVDFGDVPRLTPRC